MWYFAWILGINLAAAVAVLNAMYLEASYTSGERDEKATLASFVNAARADEARRRP
ncbi:MAG TPA: cytochrome bd-I oxidase subunit CydX [Janthinobacterium sp.]|jgi:cyd operon protein YbgT|nr:cytochrome bd-I oxidase subunit CydX [Janthinobacterium sp.]